MSRAKSSRLTIPERLGGGTKLIVVVDGWPKEACRPLNSVVRRRKAFVFRSAFPLYSFDHTALGDISEEFSMAVRLSIENIYHDEKFDVAALSPVKKVGHSAFQAWRFASAARVAVGGMLHHALKRGDRCETVFHKPADFDAFAAAMNDAPASGFGRSLRRDGTTGATQCR